MTKTNYLEAVGLILIGFGLYETIYTKAQTTQIATEFGLTSAFDQARFFAILLNCTIVALSLIMIQGHNSPGEATQPTSVSDALRQMRESFLDWRSKMAPIAIALQLFAILTVVGMFSAQAASALLIGFAFVDLAIFLEKKGWL